MRYSSSNAFIFFGLLLGLLLMTLPAKSQRSVGIGTREPNENAALQIVAPGNDQGIMIPGLTTSERQNADFVSRLGATENGLLIFDSNEQRFYYWMTNRWQPILSGNLIQIAQAGEGIEIIGSELIVNTGDTDSTDDITNETLATGELEGTFPELTIVPGVITTEKLADGSVTTLKIEDNTILPQDMASPGAGKVLVTTSAGTVFWENQSLFGITFLQQGRVYVGDSGNQPSEVDMRGEGNILVGNGSSATSVPISGDVSLSSTGNVDIQPATVSSVEIENLSIASEDLADAAVSSNKIQDAAIVTAKIADDAVDGSKIADAAVGSGEILDNSIVNDDVSTSAAIDGTKVNPAFGTQNISTSGNLSAGSAVFSAKATSDVTLDTDPASTLTTKSYVDSEINGISNNLEDGNGIVDFTYNGGTTETISVNAGRGLGFDAGQLVVSPGPGLGFDGSNNLQVSGVTSSMITDGTITNDDLAAGAALQISKLQSLGNARLIVGDGTSNNAIIMSGDANMDASGQLTLTSSAATTLGLGTVASQDANSVSITGGSIDGTLIGSSTPAAGAFTTLTATNLDGDGSALTNLNASNIASGTLDGDRLPDVATGSTYNNVDDIEIDDKGRVINVTTTPSDRRLKERIQPLGSSLESIKGIKAYSYFLKERPQLGLQYGVIAQELLEIYPSLVSERRDGYLSVDYEMLVPILIKAIQEQQDQIETLKKDLSQASTEGGESEVEQLRQENQQLREEIDAIKAALGMETPGDTQ